MRAPISSITGSNINHHFHLRAFPSSPLSLSLSNHSMWCPNAPCSYLSTHSFVIGGKKKPTMAPVSTSSTREASRSHQTWISLVPNFVNGKLGDFGFFKKTNQSARFLQKPRPPFFHFTRWILRTACSSGPLVRTRDNYDKSFVRRKVEVVNKKLFLVSKVCTRAGAATWANQEVARKSFRASGSLRRSPFVS